MRLLAKYGVTPSAYFLIQDCRGNKVPNKYLHSPPEMQKAVAHTGDGFPYRIFCFSPL